MSAVHVAGVSKIFNQGTPKQVDALVDVNLTVEPGEFVSLIGPSGCGKSTLLQLAIGTLWPTRGVVRRQGDTQVELPVFWKQIGWITDNVSSQIPADEKAGDTVLSGYFAQMGLKLFQGYELSDAQREYASAEMKRLGILELSDRSFGVLSRGERQKVLMARALVARPRCLVLDEPCVGMDPGARERFLLWLGEYLHQYLSPAVILVTHHIEEILPEFTHSLVLRSGQVLAQGRTEDVLTRETFERLYETHLARLERSAGRFWPIWGKSD